MFAYLKLPPGRPRDPSKNTNTNNKSSSLSPNPTAAPSDPPSYQPTPTPKKKRGSYASYDSSEYKAAKDAILRHLALSGDVAAAIKAVAVSHPTVVIKRTTALGWHKKMRELPLQLTNGNDLSEFDRHFSRSKQGPQGLLSIDDREFLQSVIKAHDERNAGMSRKEVIGVIAELGNVGFSKAQNHLDYLIRKKKLPQLKSSGKVVRAQVTTTNRTAVTTEKLLRTHMSQEEGEFDK